MAFQTSVLRNGEWVTETVNLQAALDASAPRQRSSPSTPKPPACGIVSQTVIESPVVHWVLPVRLRSKDSNDIAFIGDDFVQISELQPDGQVREVKRHSISGPRIRNAIVLGDSLEHGLDDDGPGHGSTVSSESQFPSGSTSLPPQILVLAIETGSLIFLFLGKGENGQLEFVWNECKPPTSLPYLGHHLAGDPTSRYIAAASPDGILVVYELEALSVLSDQYASQGTFVPVKSVRLRAMLVIIHKLDFLFPRLEDANHIILIIISVPRNDPSPARVPRIVTYEWEYGDSLQNVFAADKKGLRLPMEHKMPLLLIPIRFKTAFFAVSSQFIGVIKCTLSGSPEFEVLPNDSPAPTELHHGDGGPLWTAWARPFRRKKYFEKTDIIYLAREDGAVIHLEIDANEMMPSVTSVGCLGTNVDTAFTTAYDVFSDVLIVGGDSGPGGVWKLAPRSELQQVSQFPNWSPVVDVAVASQGVTSAQAQLEESPHVSPKPENVFSASGRGSKGTITHWRWGLRARIGLDIDIGESVRQVWVFTMDRHDERRLYGLLALPHSSLVLRFSEDLSSIEPLSPENTPFDITSRTLHAVQVSEAIIQVTETSITLIRPAETSRCSLEEALGIAGVVAENAFCKDNLVALSTYTGNQSQLHVIRTEGTIFSRFSSWDTRGEVTCLSVYKGNDDHYLVVATWFDDMPWISIYSSSGGIIRQWPLVNPHDTPPGFRRSPNFEAVTSLLVDERKTLEYVSIVIGTRCGHFLTFAVFGPNAEGRHCHNMVLGKARVDAFHAFDRHNPGEYSILVCCDNNLILFNGMHRICDHVNEAQFIWPTDSNDASLPSPPIHYVFQTPYDLSGDKPSMSLVMLSGSHLLLADVEAKIGPVPRSIPLRGTPTRLIYSPVLKCLVVALLDGNRPTLAFVDAPKGEIISVPTDKDRVETPFIQGLGTVGDRIYGLYEWQYVKDERVFNFILVTTKDGKLIIVSTEKMEDRRGRKKIRYWTRYRKDFKQPIYSVVGDANGLVYCVDRTLYWDGLDLVAKKLRPVKKFTLDSPATSLRIVGDKVLALTTSHSLEVLNHSGRDTALIHVDRVSRRPIHMIDMGESMAEGDQTWPLTLVSDQRGGIVGLWAPQISSGQQFREFETVFEGKLPFSIRRFARTKVRPPRNAKTADKYNGILTSTADDTDIVGFTMNGSMLRFTLVSLELWRVLSLIQSLALGHAVASPFTKGPIQESDINILNLDQIEHPKAMHIDGDLLRKCLQERLLEDLFLTAPAHDLLIEYITELGAYNTELERGSYRHLMYLAYDILEYVVEPLLQMDREGSTMRKMTLA